LNYELEIRKRALFQFSIIVEKIFLPVALADEMIAQATAGYPEETCGLVGGRYAGDGRDGQAVRLYPVENKLHNPVAYEMEPAQQVKAIVSIEAEGLELLAIYHSHPDGPARPSVTDLAQAYYPDQAYLIISLTDRQRPLLRAFMLASGSAREIPVLLVDEESANPGTHG
jgi:proteasome lid subunit RPN8/RPN11